MHLKAGLASRTLPTEMLAAARESECVVFALSSDKMQIAPTVSRACEVASSSCLVIPPKPLNTSVALGFAHSREEHCGGCDDKCKRRLYLQKRTQHESPVDTSDQKCANPNNAMMLNLCTPSSLHSRASVHPGHQFAPLFTTIYHYLPLFSVNSGKYRVFPK